LNGDVHHAEEDLDSETGRNPRRNLATFPLLEKIAYRVLSLLGVIDLLVRVWRVL
jgi:hypothetical protein